MAADDERKAGGDEASRKTTIEVYDAGSLTAMVEQWGAMAAQGVSGGPAAPDPVGAETMRRLGRDVPDLLTAAGRRGLLSRLGFDAGVGAGRRLGKYVAPGQIVLFQATADADGQLTLLNSKVIPSTDDADGVSRTKALFTGGFQELAVPLALPSPAIAVRGRKPGQPAATVELNAEELKNLAREVKLIVLADQALTVDRPLTSSNAALPTTRDRSASPSPRR